MLRGGTNAGRIKPGAKGTFANSGASFTPRAFTDHREPARTGNGAGRETHMSKGRPPVGPLARQRGRKEVDSRANSGGKKIPLKREKEGVVGPSKESFVAFAVPVSTGKSRRLVHAVLANQQTRNLRNSDANGWSVYREKKPRRRALTDQSVSGVAFSFCFYDFKVHLYISMNTRIR